MRSLKNIALVLVLFVATITLAGCGAKKGLVGTWKSKDYSSYVYTFNEDGTGNYDASGTIMEFTYTTEGSKISILYKGNTEPFESIYEIKDNELNIKDSFGEDTIYIRK